MSKQITFAVLILLISLFSGCQQDTAEIEQLKQRLDAIESRGVTNQKFQLIVATNLLDTADFHLIDESINEQNTIQPEFLGMVRRLQPLLAATAWPEEFQDKAKAFQDTLEAFAAALEADDLEAAKPLAAQAHEQQDDLSSAVRAWLAGEGGEAEHGEEGEHDH